MWEVRASPPRTNCPVTLLLQSEEPRAVSPLTKKNRNPKRRIDFKDDEQVETSTVDNGTASWADMVRNGHQRVAQSSSRASSPPMSQRNTIDSKENGAKKEIKERGTSRGAVYRNKKDSTGKDCTENITDISHKTFSSNNTHQSVKPRTDSKISNETACHSTVETNQNSRKSSANSDKNLSTETSSLDEDIAREHLKDEENNEGWEVVSRGRGKPVRKGYNRVHTMTSAGITERSIADYDDQIDYDVNEDGHVYDDWQYHHTSVAMEISDSDGKDNYDGNWNNSPDSCGTDEPIRTDVQVC